MLKFVLCLSPLEKGNRNEIARSARRPATLQVLRAQVAQIFHRRRGSRNPFRKRSRSKDLPARQRTMENRRPDLGIASAPRNRSRSRRPVYPIDHAKSRDQAQGLCRNRPSGQRKKVGAPGRKNPDYPRRFDGRPGLRGNERKHADFSVLSRNGLPDCPQGMHPGGDQRRAGPPAYFSTFLRGSPAAPRRVDHHAKRVDGAQHHRQHFDLSSHHTTRCTGDLQPGAMVAGC